MAHAPSKDTCCKEETEAMRVSFVVRNERFYIGDTTATDGHMITGRIEEKVKRSGQRAVLGSDKNIAVGIELPKELQSDRKLEVIIDDCEE